jgi:imidazolonepropionase-like amidohydrolase
MLLKGRLPKEEQQVQQRKQGGEEEAEIETIAEGAVVTPAFIDSHSHIGMVRSGEPEKEEEANEHMDSVYPLVNALHSIYMDDPAFKESVESGILYSTVLRGLYPNAALIPTSMIYAWLIS